MANFFFTIGWEGNGQDGEVTFARGTYDQMLDGIEEKLDDYSNREPFLVCASKETGGRESRSAENLTTKAKIDLNLK